MLNEKLSKLVGKSGGKLIYNGKLVDTPDEVTFTKLFVKNNAKFALIMPIGSAPAIMWQRFGRVTLNDYFYLSSRYFDAVCFIPKRNVMFHGFGVLAHYDAKNVNYIFKWAIDGN